MLNLEYLIEEAKHNGLPATKKRAILREYLQAIILNSIYKHNFGKQLAFTGGTALRFFYNLPRFSEDLDFDTPGLALPELKDMLAQAERNLVKEGFAVTITLKKRNNLFTAELDFRNLMKLYGISDKPNPDLMLKIEIYRPRWHLETEPGVLSLYGYNFSANLLGKANLISEKLSALLNRKRGRDIYDLLFMLRRRFPFKENVLAAQGIKGRPKEIILEYLAKLPQKELKSLAEQVRPFLFKEDDIELILKASLYAERFLNEYI